MMIFVNVRSPAGREIFVGGNHKKSFGTSPVVIARQAGTWTFETLIGGVVDFRGTVDNAEDGENIDLDLTPVDAA
jgi:hypothetical protein